MVALQILWMYDVAGEIFHIPVRGREASTYLCAGENIV